MICEIVLGTTTLFVSQQNQPDGWEALARKNNEEHEPNHNGLSYEAVGGGHSFCMATQNLRKRGDIQGGAKKKLSA